MNQTNKCYHQSCCSCQTKCIIAVILPSQRFTHPPQTSHTVLSSCLAQTRWVKMAPRVYCLPFESSLLSKLRAANQSGASRPGVDPSRRGGLVVHASLIFNPDNAAANRISGDARYIILSDPIACPRVAINYNFGTQLILFESRIGNLISGAHSLDFPYPLISFALAHQRRRHMLSHRRPRAHLSRRLINTTSCGECQADTHAAGTRRSLAACFSPSASWSLLTCPLLTSPGARLALLNMNSLLPSLLYFSLPHSASFTHPFFFKPGQRIIIWLYEEVPNYGVLRVK